MPATEQTLREALIGVKDPELRQDILDLGMVRDIKAKRNICRVVLAVPMERYPHQDILVDRVRQALQPVVGESRLEVETTVMRDEEGSHLIEYLRSVRAALSDGAEESTSSDESGHHPLGHEEGRPNQFMSPSSHTRVIGISSGKGGVGKSSVTVNLAVALTKLGKEVAVLDADVYGFSIPRMLGISRTPMAIGDMLIPPVAYGIPCVSLGFFVEEDQPVIWRGPMLHKALEQFLVDTFWGDPDYLLIDMPPGTGDVALSMAQYLPRAEIVVVTTPQPAARSVAQRSAYAARKMKLPVRGVIENMSWFTGDDGKRYELFGSGGGRALAEELEVPLLGQIPLVSALRSGGDEGLPVTLADPESEASIAFEALAKTVDDMAPARRYRKELTIR
jgi:ATP-binding protein involved in chromosome partitioning